MALPPRPTQRDWGKARSTDIATAPALLLYDPIMLPTSGGPDARLDVIARLGSSMRAMAPVARQVLAVSVDDQELLDALLGSGATRLMDVDLRAAPTSVTVRAEDADIAPLLEDVVKKLASAWPADRPDA